MPASISARSFFPKMYATIPSGPQHSRPTMPRPSTSVARWGFSPAAAPYAPPGPGGNAGG